MPIYYFDVDDGGRLSRDDTGIVLPDQASAEREAIKLVAEVGVEMLTVHNGRISVGLRTENGVTVFSAWIVMSTAHH